MMNWNNNDTKYIIKRLLLYLIITGIVFFAGTKCVHALTLGGWGITQYDETNGSHFHDLKPQAYAYNNEYFNTTDPNADFFAQNIQFTPYKMTTNFNWYFNSPCQQGEKITYTERINFYKIGSTDYNMEQNAGVVNAIDGCTGYWTKQGTTWTYINQCSLNNGIPKGSLYFAPNLRTNQDAQYRIGLESNFQYECSINTGALINNNNANTQQIIQNNNNNSQQIINNAHEDAQNIINSMNEARDVQQATQDYLTEDYSFDQQMINDFGIFGTNTNYLQQILMWPYNLALSLGSALSGTTCSTYSFGYLYGTELKLPCIDWKQYVGNTIYVAIDTIMGMGLLFGVITFIRKAFEYVLNFGSDAYETISVEVFK